MLYHVTDINKALSEVKRVLKPGEILKKHLRNVIVEEFNGQIVVGKAGTLSISTRTGMFAVSK